MEAKKFLAPDDAGGDTLEEVVTTDCQTDCTIYTNSFRDLLYFKLHCIIIYHFIPLI